LGVTAEIRTQNLFLYFSVYVNHTNKSPWRRGIVVIASAYISDDPGYESRRGVKFSGMYTLQFCCHNNLICFVIVCTWEKILNFLMNIKSIYTTATTAVFHKIFPFAQRFRIIFHMMVK
jgi:hypothetical protein